VITEHPVFPRLRGSARPHVPMSGFLPVRLTEVDREEALELLAQLHSAQNAFYWSHEGRDVTPYHRPCFREETADG
jgi:hypothetical protein